jgi:hypothetical protein
MSIYEEMLEALEAKKHRSAWDKGVTSYAIKLTCDLEEAVDYAGKSPKTPDELNEWLLNGAKDWSQYSWYGNSLISDYAIALTLCNASELKRTNYGERKPNRREDWLDVQARALYQAAEIVKQLYRGLGGYEEE